MATIAEAEFYLCVGNHKSCRRLEYYVPEASASSALDDAEGQFCS